MGEERETSLAYEGNLGALKLKVAQDAKIATAKDANERTPLHWACSGGRYEVADFLVGQLKVPVNMQDDAGWTPLMIASSAGHDEIVTLLLENGADVHVVNLTGQSGLHYAASKNRLSIAKLLLQSGAEVNIMDRTTGASPLHRAASRGHLKMVQLLVQNDSAVSKEDNYRNTPLHLACEEGRTDVIEFLVKNGADVGVKNKENQLPIDMAPDRLAGKLKDTLR